MREVVKYETTKGNLRTIKIAEWENHGQQFVSTEGKRYRVEGDSLISIFESGAERFTGVLISRIENTAFMLTPKQVRQFVRHGSRVMEQDLFAEITDDEYRRLARDVKAVSELQPEVGAVVFDERRMKRMLDVLRPDSYKVES